MSSFFEKTSPTPGATNYIRLLIDDVDPVNRVVHAFDKTGVRVQALYGDQGSVLLVPTAGETWTAMRRGYSWWLTARVDLSDVMSDLEPGTLYLDTARVRMEGGYGEIAGNPWGATIYDHYYDLNNGFTSVVLSRDPVGTAPITPYLNGLAVMPDLWTYDSTTRTLTFYAEVGEIGNLVVSYQTWGNNNDDAATVIGRGRITAIEEFIDV